MAFDRDRSSLEEEIFQWSTFPTSWLLSCFALTFPFVCLERGARIIIEWLNSFHLRLSI